MNEKPLVSVIIPTHNRAELLRTALESVIKQTLINWEALVVDDHSNDHTHQVVNDFNDKRIQYIKNCSKNGPSVSRNIGIIKASGNFIAFLDDDDEWVPSKLENQINVFNSVSDNYCAVYSNRLMINKESGETYSDDPDVVTVRGDLLSQLMIKSPVHTSTLVVRKNCLDEIGGFDEDMRYMEDTDLLARLAMKWRFEYVDEPLVKAYFHGNSHLSRNIEGKIEGMMTFLHRYQDEIIKNRKNWSNFLIVIGTQYCQLQRMREGIQTLLKGISIYPFNKLAFFHIAAACLGPTCYQKLRKNYISSVGRK